MTIALQKFTPLSAEKIKEIVNALDPEPFARFSEKIESAKTEYQKLITEFRDSEDKRKFFEENFLDVSKFLTKCGLIGLEGELGLTQEGFEKDAEDSFGVGAEALSVISAIIKAKERNQNKDYQVQVVKNLDLVASDQSVDNAKIDRERGHIHSGLYKQICEDLDGKLSQEFAKTYVVEVFGHTGTNHFATLTIQKGADESNPTIHLFDSSVALGRNGLEATQNSIAAGCSTQIIINATLKKALHDVGLVFDTQNYFNNSEPLQKVGSSFCSEFAIEEAHRIASQGLNSSIYCFESPFGGKTEMDIENNLSKDGFIAKDSPLALPAETAFKSNYTEAALKPRHGEMLQKTHQKKDGSDETLLERAARYQTEEGQSDLIWQKQMRQLCHLFEIISSDVFSEKIAALIPKEQASENANSCFWHHRNILRNLDPEAKKVVESLNKILPGWNRVSEIDQAENGLKMTFYLGKISSEKLIDKFSPEKSLCTIASEEISIADKLSDDVSPDFSSYQKIEISLERQKFEEFKKLLPKEAFLAKNSPDNLFSKPTNTDPIKVTGSQALSLHSQTLQI